MEIFQRSKEPTGKNSLVIAEMFRALLPAQILATATSSLSGVVNGLLIGNYLPQAGMVAMGFVAPVTTLLGALSGVITGGARVLCGRAMGEGNAEKINSIFTLSVLLLTLIGAALTYVGYRFCVPLAGILGAQGELVDATAQYIRGFALGIIPTLLTPCFMVFLQMGNASTYSLMGAVVLAAASLGLGLLNLEVLRGGVFGMGLSVSLAQVVSMVFLILRFVIDKNMMHFRLRGLPVGLAGSIVVIGFPTTLAIILYSLRNTMLNGVGLYFGGADGVAALAILNSVGGFIDAFVAGIGAVVIMLASVYIGVKDEKSLEALGSYVLRFGLILNGIKIAILIFIAKPIAILFGSAGAQVSITSNLLIIYSFSAIPNAFLQVEMSTHVCAGRVRMVSIIYLFGCIIIPISLAYGLGFLFGLNGAWLCYVLTDVLVVLILRVIAWKKNGHFPMRMHDLLWLPQNLEDNLSISLRTVEEARTAAQRASEFCLSHGVDEKRSSHCGLCVEELSVNVVEHGFTKTRRGRRSVDIFLCVTDGEVQLRMCDNAPRFDPHSKPIAFDPENPTKNLGLRVVAGLAKDLSYQATFGMNVVTIVL